MRKRVPLPGRRLVAVAAIALGLTALSAAPKPSKSVHDGDLVTADLRFVCTGRGTSSDKDMPIEDSFFLEIRHSFTWRIKEWSEANDRIETVPVSKKTEVTVQGGGHAVWGKEPVTWKYQKKEGVRDPWYSLHLDPHGEKNDVMLHADPGEFAEAVGQGERVGKGGMIAGTAAGLALANALMDLDKPSLGGVGPLQKELVFTFSPKERQIFRSGSATKNYSKTEGRMKLDGSVTVDYKVSIGRPSDDQVEVEIVPPKGYEQWLPQADEDEKTLGNYLDVGIVAHKKDEPDSPPPKKVLKYRITLQGTSKEPGVDLNWPPEERAKKDFDVLD